MKQFTSLILAAILGGAIALGGFFYINKGEIANTQIEASLGKKVSNQSPTNFITNSTPEGFTMAAEKAMPAVVHIKARKTNRNTSRSNDPADLFREFFGDDFGYGPQEGSGSGVIFRRDGYIVTNNHVVEGANELEVTLFDNRTFRAELIGRDPNTDLAVLKIDGTNFPMLDFSDSDGTKVGEWVLAVGNPFDLTSTVTAGIISAKGRNIDILGGGSAIESFIQTDAAVNPGNSGGALINTKGNLIGVNTAIMTRTGMFQGYSFAVPSNIVEKVVDDLIQFGATQRGYIGVNIRDMDSQIAQELGLNITKGVHVVSLMDNGAALKAGVLPDDVITAVNGKSINTSPELQELVGQKRPGDKVVLDINRQGNSKRIEVILKQ